MAKKKNTNQNQKALKPEDYLRTKVRLLPIYKCFKSENTLEDREMSIIVVRQHPQGTYTLGAYMIDRWCLGVKDTLWLFSVNKDKMDEFLGFFRTRLNSLDEIDYAEAHNWIYGAVAFAEDAGIKPCKDFALTQYILAPDDDDTELIEYEFGRDGEYCLVAKNGLEASLYTPILDKTLGKGNYDVEIGCLDDDDEDDEDDEDFFPFAITPDMEYTYEGKEYPKNINLNYPELDDILSEDMEDISDSDIDKILSLPADSLREDLHNIILRELGIQWGKTIKDYNREDDDSNMCYVSNSLMFLTSVGTVEDTLPVVLEVMRQNDHFRDYNFGDISDILLEPALWTLIKDNPRLLMPYLLEKGLASQFKIFTLEMLEHIAQNCEDVRDEIIDMAVELLGYYKKDLPDRTICDGTVVAFAIGILVGNSASEHLPLIEEIYATGLVDEGVEGHIEEVRREIMFTNSPWRMPPLDPYAIKKKYQDLVKQSY